MLARPESSRACSTPQVRPAPAPSSAAALALRSNPQIQPQALPQPKASSTAHPPYPQPSQPAHPERRPRRRTHRRPWRRSPPRPRTPPHTPPRRTSLRPTSTRRPRLTTISAASRCAARPCMPCAHRPDASAWAQARVLGAGPDLAMAPHPGPVVTPGPSTLAPSPAGADRRGE